MYFLSECGVQQGDPLGPLYFCCGLQSLVDKIKALHPVYQKWYMDDGGIVGPVDMLEKVWEILKTEGPRLHLNPAKCEWSWLNGECTKPCPIEGVPVTPTTQIQMLGVPLGSGDFVAKFVEDGLLPTTKSVCEKLGRLSIAPLPAAAVIWDHSGQPLHANDSAPTMVCACCRV